MERPRHLPVVLAVAGCGAIAIGIFQGLVHVAPGYEGTITSGWDGALSRQEVLLGLLGAVGAGGAVAGRRWRRLAAVPVAAGGVVLFFTLRAVYGQFQPPKPLYQEFPVYGAGFEGESVVLILGLEPFLLAAGAVLLVGAGLAQLKAQPPGEESDRPAATPPAA